MVVVPACEVDRMSTHDAGSMAVHGKAGSMSADVGGCKVADAAGTTAMKATTVKTATMTAAVAATAVALGSECCRRE
jgi:hypothetical protein